MSLWIISKDEVNAEGYGGGGMALTTEGMWKFERIMNSQESLSLTAHNHCLSFYLFSDERQFLFLRLLRGHNSNVEASAAGKTKNSKKIEGYCLLKKRKLINKLLFWRPD